MYRLAKKFDQTGFMDDALWSGRSIKARTEDKTNLVSAHFISAPQTSQRRASIETKMARASVQRMMKDLQLKPYKPRLLQALNEDDPGRRIEFCE